MAPTGHPDRGGISSAAHPVYRASCCQPCGITSHLEGVSTMDAPLRCMPRRARARRSGYMRTSVSVYLSPPPNLKVKWFVTCLPLLLRSRPRGIQILNAAWSPRRRRTGLVVLGLVVLRTGLVDPWNVLFEALGLTAQEMCNGTLAATSPTRGAYPPGRVGAPPSERSPPDLLAARQTGGLHRGRARPARHAPRVVCPVPGRELAHSGEPGREVGRGRLLRRHARQVWRPRPGCPVGRSRRLRRAGARSGNEWLGLRLGFPDIERHHPAEVFR